MEHDQSLSFQNTLCLQPELSFHSPDTEYMASPVPFVRNQLHHYFATIHRETVRQFVKFVEELSGLSVREILCRYFRVIDEDVKG